MTRLFVILLLLQLSAFGTTTAQQTNDSTRSIFDLSGEFSYNTILAGRGNQQFASNHPLMFQLDAGITKNSQQKWNYCNCYSRNGLSFAYIDFNNAALGQAFAVSAFVEPQLYATSGFSVSLRGSAGLAFLSNVYDSISNKENIFVSTPVSYLLSVGIKTSWSISNNVDLVGGLEFKHISNGGRRDPNDGLNFPGVHLGIRYRPHPVKLLTRTKEKFTDKSFGIMINVLGAQRTAVKANMFPETTALIAGVNAAIIKRIGRMNAFGVGGEVYYDGINSTYQQRTGLPLQTVVAGAGLQHYLFFGKLLFGQQFNWYLSSATPAGRSVFQRYFLEYEIVQHWYAGVSLKAHGDQSDFMALSVGRLIRIQ